MVSSTGLLSSERSVIKVVIDFHGPLGIGIGVSSPHALWRGVFDRSQASQVLTYSSISLFILGQ